jgi:hypothetical protein
MHEDDTPEGILGADNQPRLVGTVFKYLKTHGEEVKEEEVIVSDSFKIFLFFLLSVKSY